MRSLSQVPGAHIFWRPTIECTTLFYHAIILFVLYASAKLAFFSLFLRVQTSFYFRAFPCTVHSISLVSVVRLSFIHLCHLSLKVIFPQGSFLWLSLNYIPQVRLELHVTHFHNIIYFSFIGLNTIKIEYYCKIVIMRFCIHWWV